MNPIIIENGRGINNRVFSITTGWIFCMCVSDAACPGGATAEPEDWAKCPFVDGHMLVLTRIAFISNVYSPSPEYPAACWSEAEIPLIGAAGMTSLRLWLRPGKMARRPAEARKAPVLRSRLLRRMERWVGFGEFRLDTPQLAAGSFIGKLFLPEEQSCIHKF
jgi:hypothetical protein